MKRPSLRKAIYRHCRDCIFNPKSSGKWRQQVLACTSLNCALFEVRPIPSTTSRKGSPQKTILGDENGCNTRFHRVSGGE